MSTPKAVLTGYLHGIDRQGAPACVSVYYLGTDIQIVFGEKVALCHPYVRTVDDIKAEVALAFGVRKTEFEEA